MIGVMIGSALYLAAMQAAVNVPRAAFSACLKQAGQKASAEKVQPDAYSAYIKGLCTNESAAFKNALVSFDVKNGIGRKQAATDADVQIEDYIVGSFESYQARFPVDPKAAATTAPPAPTPASSPQ